MFLKLLNQSLESDLSLEGEEECLLDVLPREEGLRLDQPPRPAALSNGRKGNTTGKNRAREASAFLPEYDSGSRRFCTGTAQHNSCTLFLPVWVPHWQQTSFIMVWAPKTYLLKQEWTSWWIAPATWPTPLLQAPFQRKEKLWSPQHFFLTKCKKIY